MASQSPMTILSRVRRQMILLETQPLLETPSQVRPIQMFSVCSVVHHGAQCSALCFMQAVYEHIR